MRKLSFLIVIFLIIASCSAMKAIKLAEGGEVINKQEEDQVINFENQDNLILIDVSINRNKPYKFLLSTNSHTIMKEEIFNDLNLNKDVELKGDKTLDYKNVIFTKLDLLSIGKMRIKNSSAIVVDKNTFDRLNRLPIDGVLGSNVLKNFNITIDYKSQKLIISNKTEKMDSEFKIKFYKNSNGIPYFKVLLDNNLEVLSTIATSSFDNLISENIFKDQYKKNIKYSQGNFDPKTTNLDSIQYFMIPNIKIGTYTENNLPVITYLNKEKVLVLGLEFLSNFKIYIDNKNEEILFISNKENDRKKYNSSFGIATKLSYNKLIIMGVWKDTQAEKNGIKPNDEIITLNGKKINEFSFIEMNKIFLNSQSIDLIIKSDNTEKKVTLKKEQLIK